MAIDFTTAKMSNVIWPPAGDVTYPDKYTIFVNLNETAATELINAREGENSLVLNLQNNYLTSTLATNIVGNGFKFTGMPDGTAASTDYATVSQVQAIAILAGVVLPEVDELNNTSSGYGEVFHAEFNVDVAGAEGTFSSFEYNSDVTGLLGSTIKYPTAFNKTYTYTWGSTPTLIDLDSVSAPNPNLGDRIRLVNINPREFDGIQASTSLIHGLSEKITFGAAVYHTGVGGIATTTNLYDGSADFTNVRIGDLAYHIASDQYVAVTDNPAPIAQLTTQALSGANWASAYIVGETYSHAIYDLVYTTQSGWLFKHVLTG